MNMQMLMQQANKMKKDMEKAQEEVEQMTFSSSQPLVDVKMNGKKEVLNIEINKDITTEDIEVLQDMILIAFNDCIKQADKAMNDKLGKYGSIPGLF